MVVPPKHPKMVISSRKKPMGQLGKPIIFRKPPYTSTHTNWSDFFQRQSLTQPPPLAKDSLLPGDDPTRWLLEDQDLLTSRRKTPRDVGGWWWVVHLLATRNHPTKKHKKTSWKAVFLRF